VIASTMLVCIRKIRCPLGLAFVLLSLGLGPSPRAGFLTTPRQISSFRGWADHPYQCWSSFGLLILWFVSYFSVSDVVVKKELWPLHVSSGYAVWTR